MTPNSKTAKTADPATTRTISAAADLLSERAEQRVRDGVITYRHGGNISRNAHAWTDLVLRGERFGDVEVTCVSVTDIEDILVPQLTGAAKTTKEKLGALKQLFDLAIREDWSSSNPARQVRLESDRYSAAAPEGSAIERFDVDEIRRLIEAALTADADWCDGLAVALAAQTGLRFGEQSALRWKDIDLVRGRVSVRLSRRVIARGVIAAGVPKTRAARRTIFLTSRLVAEIKRWRLRSPASNDDDVVFITRALTPQSSSDNWRTRVLRPACDEAGIDHLRWHDLRHFFASVCLDIFGADFHRITALLGHKSISTTREIYGHWIDDPDRDEEDAQDLQRKIWGSPS